MKKIVMLCLSAGIQKTICFESFVPGEVNRSKSYRFDASGKAINSARVLTQLVGETGSAATNLPAVREDSATNSLAAKEDSAAVSVSVVCPLGERNKDFFLEMAAADSLNVRCVPIPGFTRECCTILDGKSGQTTELVVEEPVINADSAPFEETLLQILRAELGLDRNGTDCLADGSGSTSDGTERGLDSAEKASNTQKANALLFSGSRPSFWNAGIVKRIAAMAKDNGILFMADFRGNDLLSILDEYTPDIIKINEDEFWATFGKNSPVTFGTNKELPATFGTRREQSTTFGTNSPTALGGDTNATENADGTGDADSTSSAANHEEQLSAAIAEKSRQLNNIIVVTRGSKPTLAAEKGKPYHSMSERVKAVNTIGCGDAYNAGFLYEYLTTKNMEKSLEKGKWCASRNAECLRPGVLHD